MSDNHAGGLAAIEAIFPGITKLRCFFHLSQNIQRKLATLNLKDHLVYIKWVLKTLKQADTQDNFHKIWELFKPEGKQITGSDELVEYMQKNIIKSEAKWFNGASFAGKQKCNNSLESMNR